MSDVQGGDIAAQKNVFPNTQFWLSYYLLKTSQISYTASQIWRWQPKLSSINSFLIELSSYRFHSIIYAVLIYYKQIYQFMQRPGGAGEASWFFKDGTYA